MQAAHMSFEEEVIKLRSECKHLRLENAHLKKKNNRLTKKVLWLEQENRAVKRENNLLKEEQRLLLRRQQELEKQIESLQLIVEELRGMVFGKKKTQGGGEKNSLSGETNDTDTQDIQTKKRKKADRAKESYRRAAPSDEEVTQSYEHSLTHCPDCGTVLLRLKQIIRFVEDIAALTMLPKLLKKIDRHSIGSGYCPTCKKRKVTQEITPQVSVLGENVKGFVAYLVVIMRLSFEQVRSFLCDSADFPISDGEISASLDEQAERLRPERERLLDKIRGAPGSHYDETGWKTRGGQGDYCWIKRPTEGTEAVFLLGRSRGKGNAQELQGAVDNQVGITDEYGAYENMFRKHQLCMAHPQRKLRDLAESKSLGGASKAACVHTYEGFSSLYKELQDTLASEYQKEMWLQKREEYIERLKTIAVLRANDPKKLRAIKEGLQRNAQKYVTCLLEPGIPADNNKAERGLRHIVLKRKTSYGSKSQKGADTMSILCSTLLSAWWNKPANFFVAYNQMLTP